MSSNRVPADQLPAADVLARVEMWCDKAGLHIHNGAGGARGVLRADGVRQMIARRCKAAGVRRINPHALRHGFAMTMLNEGGVTMDAVAKMLGHSDPSITRRFYAHYLDEEIDIIYEDAIARTRKR